MKNPSLSFMIRRTLPLPLSDGTQIPYRFGKNPVIGKEAAEAKDWPKIAPPIEERNKGKSLPHQIGRFIAHRDGVETIHEAGNGWTANFVLSYIPSGTRIAERKIVVQGVLKHCKVPHLPLRTDSKALLLAREGITLQEALPPRGRSVGMWLTETPSFQDCLEELQKRSRYPISSEEVWEEFRVRFAQRLGRRPEQEDLYPVALEGIKMLFGLTAQKELETFLLKIEEIENDKVLMKEARERGYAGFPGNSLIHCGGMQEFWGGNIFYDSNARPGKRFFLYSW